MINYTNLTVMETSIDTKTLCDNLEYDKLYTAPNPYFYADGS